jgi:hypothetical protein
MNKVIDRAIEMLTQMRMETGWLRNISSFKDCQEKLKLWDKEVIGDTISGLRDLDAELSRRAEWPEREVEKERLSLENDRRVYERLTKGGKV